MCASVQSAPTKWGELVGGMNALLNAALTDVNNYKFVFVSASTIPVKRFDKVYGSLMATESSYFCITPSDQWARFNRHSHTYDRQIRNHCHSQSHSQGSVMT